MEGLTPEQAAQAAQWGPDIGPPGPVSYIMHILQTQGEEAAISGQDPESPNGATGSGVDSSVSASSAENPPMSTPTSNTVSTTPSSFETSSTTLSTTQESSSSAPTTTSDTISTTSDTFSLDPATSTGDWPVFSLGLPTTSSTSTTVSSSSTDEPIASFTFAPTSSFISIPRPTTTSTFSTPTNIGSQATETPSSDMINMSSSRKQAIVGGLGGAIGALVVIGILLCFCLRRRHRREDEDEDEEDGLEKSIKPAKTIATKPSTVRLWNALGRTPARSTPEISKPRTPSPVDGSLIRVSTEHWSRPFVRKEGMRESLEPAPLRVINANSNSSRSSTPEDERPNGFVRKQRSALAALLQDGARTGSRNAIKRGPISYPKPMVGDPIYSSKATVDSGAETLSVGSLPSDTSSPLVVQQPPEDPFFASTTVLSTMEEVAPPMQTTEPTKTELTRTVSHFGKNANPFRTQIVPSVALPPRVFSPTTGTFRDSDVGESRPRRSSIGSNYSRRDTACTLPIRASDQFDLMVSPDQMPPASGILAKAAEYERKEKEKKEKKEREQREREQTPAEDYSSPNWKVYEGT